MSKPPLEFMKKYGIDSDEIWEVRPRTYAIKHVALERVALEQKITFDHPLVLESAAAEKIAVVCVTGRQGDRSEWSIGEAAPYNNKNGYPFAMAEKRAKDRVVLKLLNADGDQLYSDAESDDFQRRENPHVTRPSDIVPTVEYNDHGEPIDNIPRGDERLERMTRAKAKPDFALAQNELYKTKTPAELEAWGKANANRIETYPADFQDILRGLYSEHMASLRAPKQEVA